MEKRIPFFHFQSVKSVAKAIDPYLKTMDKLRGDVHTIKEAYEARQAKLKAEFEERVTKIKQEYDNCQLQIEALEAGILQNTGFHVSDLVKKVMEPTGKTDVKTGKSIKITKYLPTDIVSYDETTKEYVITVPDNEDTDENAPDVVENTETVIPSTTENTSGSDYDKDAESLETHEEESEREAAETEAEKEEGNALPWE